MLPINIASKIVMINAPLCTKYLENKQNFIIILSVN